MDRVKNENLKPYVDYIVEQAKALLAIDSPYGYGKDVSADLLKELDNLGSRGWKTRNTTLRSACNMPEESPGSRKTRSVARRSPIPCPTARKADAFPAGCRDDARLQSAAQPRTMFRARPETPRKRMKNAVRGFSNALPAAARERSRRG